MMISKGLMRGALVVVAVVALGACGSDDSTDAISSDTGAPGSPVEGELLPFSLVQENDFAFESDPTDPNRGIFRVRTIEPMICAIVWGETEEFGNFNNSLAMNGTGIIDHDVVLPGAEQGRTYFFQVQGSTADGGQYRSDVGTFTVPVDESAASAEIAAHGANLALDADVIDVSSVFGPGWEAENAIDDDTNSEWASQGDGDRGFITIDLGAPHEIAGVEFLTRSMLDGTATTEMYTVTVDDGDPIGPFPAGNPAEPGFSALELNGQKFRFEVDTSSGGNVGAVEVRVFAPA